MKVGIDIIEIERVLTDDEFVDRIAVKGEKDYINSFNTEQGKRERIASLWTVKEAVFKCLEVGRNSGAVMSEIELCHQDNGKPFVKFSGYMLDRFNKLNLKNIEVSISHSKTIATAIVIAN